MVRSSRKSALPCCHTYGGKTDSSAPWRGVHSKRAKASEASPGAGTASAINRTSTRDGLSLAVDIGSIRGAFRRGNNSTESGLSRGRNVPVPLPARQFLAPRLAENTSVYRKEGYHYDLWRFKNVHFITKANKFDHVNNINCPHKDDTLAQSGPNLEEPSLR